MVAASYSEHENIGTNGILYAVTLTIVSRDGYFNLRNVHIKVKYSHSGLDD